MFLLKDIFANEKIFIDKNSLYKLSFIIITFFSVNL